MNKGETAEILSYIEASYPGKMKATFNTPADIVNVWSFHLANQSFDDTRERLRRYILDGNKFPPSIANMVIPPRPEAHRRDWKDKMERYERKAAPPPDDLEPPQFVKDAYGEEKAREIVRHYHSEKRGGTTE